MISIIIPSRNTKALKSISDNISKSIGVPYEIIDYDNTNDGFGICKIYNLCAQKAQFKNLVFCHDDIVFHSHDWGKELIHLLQQDKIGLVGVAGATFKSKYPAPWVSVPKVYYRSSLTNTDNKESTKVDYFDEVVVMDGCFLAMTKRTWGIFPYNEKELKGFHLYDIDISLRISKKLKTVVTNSIFINHLSEGTFDKNWYEESKRFHLANKNLFPASIDKKYNQNFLNAYAARSLLFRSKSINMGYYSKLKYLFSILSLAPIKLFSFRLVNFLIK